MKESYVLKRRNGEACGYVMARDKEVRVRLPNEKGTAKMAVIYADQTQTLEGMLDGLERTYPAAGSRLLGAYVCSDGRLLMDTGEAARRAFERAEEACQSAQRPEGKRKDARGEDARTQAGEACRHVADEVLAVQALEVAAWRGGVLAVHPYKEG